MFYFYWFCINCPFWATGRLLFLVWLWHRFSFQQAIFAYLHFTRIDVIFRFYSWLSFHRLRRLYGTVRQSTAANCITYVNNAYIFFSDLYVLENCKNTFLSIFTSKSMSYQLIAYRTHLLTARQTPADLTSSCNASDGKLQRNVVIPPHSIVATVAKLTEQLHSRGLELLTVNQHQ